MVYFLFNAYPPQCKQLEEAPTGSKFPPKWDDLQGRTQHSAPLFVFLDFLKYESKSTVQQKSYKQYVCCLTTTVVTILSKSKHELAGILCISLRVIDTMAFCLD